jgi:hypothetical protein
MGCADTTGQHVDIQQKEAIIALESGATKKSTYTIKIF